MQEALRAAARAAVTEGADLEAAQAAVRAAAQRALEVQDAANDDVLDRIGAVIGRRLAQARTDSGYSLTDAAARAGISPALLLEIEEGLEAVDVENLVAITAVYGLGAGEFVDSIQTEVAPLLTPESTQAYVQSNPWLIPYTED